MTLSSKVKVRIWSFWWGERRREPLELKARLAVAFVPPNSGLLLRLAGGFFVCGVFASFSQRESGGRTDE
jgi:hypothetical protein